jgi:ribosomal protein S18 acetylase RimI-like enzyme
MNYRGKDFAERLLKESIEEMKLNGISFITLYVMINNHHAIQLYKKLVLGQLLRLKMYVAMRRLITKWN